jgi:hypothetical protein
LRREEKRKLSGAVAFTSKRSISAKVLTRPGFLVVASRRGEFMEQTEAQNWRRYQSVGEACNHLKTALVSAFCLLSLNIRCGCCKGVNGSGWV